jgi:hypothetical protein
VCNLADDHSSNAGVQGVKGTAPIERLLGAWSGPYLFFIPLLAAVICFLYAYKLTNSIRNITYAQEKLLDERQRVMRDRAYHHAYQIIAIVFPLFALFFAWFSELDGLMPVYRAQGMVVYLTALCFTRMLPTIITAWREPEV